MLTKEEIESWNKLFSEYQIHKNNLSNPNEHFLTNVLVGYLRHFGFNIEPPFMLNAEDNENNRPNRIFLIKLARQINHFLKITDKSYSFTYFDLIRPTPKKTTHTLSILLNYYYYYNLYKEEVFKMAVSKIQMLDELKANIDDTRRENENRQEEHKNRKSTIENLKKEVPIARSQLNELHERKTRQEEEFEKVNQSYQDLKEKLKHLEKEKKLLRKRSVPDEEYQKLKNEILQLELDLKKYVEMDSSITANLNNCKESNLQLQNLIIEIGKAHELVSLHLMQQVQDTKKELERVQNEEQDLQHNKADMLHAIEEENLKKYSAEQEQHNKNIEHQEKRIELMNTLDSRQHNFEQKGNVVRLLEKDDKIVDCKLNEQKDIAHYLQENLSELLQTCGI